MNVYTEGTGNERNFDLAEGEMRSIFQSVGIDWDQLPQTLRARFKSLNAETGTVDDEIQAIAYAECLRSVLSPDTLRNVQQATLFTDIGKTGPAGASDQEKDFITRIYSVREKFSIEQVTLEQFLSQRPKIFLREDHETVYAMGMEGSETMRTFFNRHAEWTLSLLESVELPDEVIISAVNHHFLEGVHPGNMIDREGNIQYRETHRPFGVQEVYVILLDKYDASRTRGGKTHEQAIGWLQEFVRKFAKGVLDQYPPHIREMFEAGIAEMDRALAAPAQQQEEELAAK